MKLASKIFLTTLAAVSLVACSSESMHTASNKASSQAKMQTTYYYPTLTQEQAYATFKKEKGVKVTSSGVAYYIYNEGEGRFIKPDDTLKVNYYGTYTNGMVFDSAVNPTNPVEFPLVNLIPGFREAMTKIKNGGEIIFYLPPELGYGNRQVGSIPANSYLVFRVNVRDLKRR